MTHSKLPFRVMYNYDNRTDQEFEGRHTIKDADDWNIARIWEHPAPNPEGDAEFIVKACNMHEELVDALGFLLDEFDSRVALVETCDLEDSELDAMETARKLIEKSKETK